MALSVLMCVKNSLTHSLTHLTVHSERGLRVGAKICDPLRMLILFAVTFLLTYSIELFDIHVISQFQCFPLSLQFCGCPQFLWCPKLCCGPATQNWGTLKQISGALRRTLCPNFKSASALCKQYCCIVNRRSNHLMTGLFVSVRCYSPSA